MNKPTWTAALRPAAMVLALCLASGGALAHSASQHGAPRHGTSGSAEEHSFGKAGNPRKVTRTVMIDMSDAFRFTPSAIAIRQGETIRFAIRNRGKMLHEMVIGTMDELKEHAELMKKFPNMEHAEPYMSHVSPGHRGDLVWQFTQPGEFYFACLIPGHYEAGMWGKITVSGK